MMVVYKCVVFLVEMWYVWIPLLLLGYVWRRLMLVRLTVSTRDLRVLHGVRGALRLLWADENLAVFDPSRDRSAWIPGESRRKKVRMKRTGREAAMSALKKRLKG